MSAYWDLINLGVCIKNQADHLGIEHEGIPLEGVVVRIAERALESGDPSPSGPASQLERGINAPSRDHENGSRA